MRISLRGKRKDKTLSLHQLYPSSVSFIPTVEIRLTATGFDVNDDGMTKDVRVHMSPAEWLTLREKIDKLVAHAILKHTFGGL